MSFRLDWVLAVRDDDRIPSFEKHLALTLSTYMDEDGFCWPSIETIAKAMNVTVRAVQLHLNGRDQKRGVLIVLGYLAVDRSTGRSSHRFQAKLPRASSPETEEDSTVNDVHRNGERGSLNDERRSPELFSNSKENSPRATDTGGEPLTSFSEAEILEAWRDLVDDLPDADDRTLDVFTHSFPTLGPPEIDWAHRTLVGLLEWDPDRIRCPSAYLYKILKDAENGARRAA